MRAPGIIQCFFVMECILEHVSAALGVPLISIQETNFITDGKVTVKGLTIRDCTLPVVWSTMKEKSGYATRYAAATAFNAENLWRKRGVACAPVRYTIGWKYSRAGVRLGVRVTDGTITVVHNGVDMGQGIHTKVAQTVAFRLGVDVSSVRVLATGTDKVVNGGFTGGSFGSETVCQAVLNACDNFNTRIAPYRKRAGSATVAAAGVAADAIACESVMEGLSSEAVAIKGKGQGDIVDESLFRGDAEKKEKDASDEPMATLLTTSSTAATLPATATVSEFGNPAPSPSDPAASVFVAEGSQANGDEEEEEDWVQMIQSLPPEISLNVEGW